MLDPAGVFTFTIDASAARSAELTQALVGSSLLSRFQGPPHQMVRSAERTADGRDFVALCYTRSGHATVRQDGRLSENEPGSLVLYRTNAPFSYIATKHSDMAGFVTSRSHLSVHAARVLRYATGLNVPVTAISQAAIALMDQVHTTTKSLTLDEGRIIERTLISTINAVIEQCAVVPGVNAQENMMLLAQARALIAEHSSEVQYDPAQLADDLDVGLRRLQRLFESEPHTPAQSIRIRRAQSLADLLSDPRDMRNVDELAGACGFAGPDQAARTFRELYGMTMSDYRRASRLSATDNALH